MLLFIFYELFTYKIINCCHITNMVQIFEIQSPTVFPTIIKHSRNISSRYDSEMCFKRRKSCYICFYEPVYSKDHACTWNIYKFSFLMQSPWWGWELQPSSLLIASVWDLSLWLLNACPLAVTSLQSSRFPRVTD